MEIDEEGRILHCRSGHLALLAEVADSFEGQRLQDIVALKPLRAATPRCRRPAPQGISRAPVRVDLQGRPYWFELDCQKVRAQRVDPAFPSRLSRDITERKQAEARRTIWRISTRSRSCPTAACCSTAQNKQAGARKSGANRRLAVWDPGQLQANQRRTQPCRGDVMLKRSRSACWICNARRHGWPGWGDEFVMLIGSWG